MKNTYVKPEMQVEEFLAENYCSSTCTSGEKYLFTCNTDAENGTYYYIYQETNGIPGLQTGKGGDTQKYSSWGGFTGCGDTHEADTRDAFADGYITDSDKKNEKKVVIWFEGSGGTNANGHVDIHVTNNLDQQHWTTVKS